MPAVMAAVTVADTRDEESLLSRNSKRAEM